MAAPVRAMSTHTHTAVDPTPPPPVPPAPPPLAPSTLTPVHLARVQAAQSLGYAATAFCGSGAQVTGADQIATKGVPSPVSRFQAARGPMQRMPGQ